MLDVLDRPQSTPSPAAAPERPAASSRGPHAGPSPIRPLTRPEIAAFFETGYVRVDGVFAPAELDTLRAACDRLQVMAERLGATGMHRGAQFVLGDRPDGGVRIDRIVWCGAAEPVLLDLGRDPRLLGMAAQLLGARQMQQLINQVHFKIPGDGVEFPWHQDSLHRRYGTPEWRHVNGRGSYVQIVTAVDACTLDNGPLLFVDGSCRHGHIEVGADQKLPDRYIEPDRVAAIAMPAGSVVLFGPYTIHGSTPNRSNRPRRLFINGYAALGANTRTYPGEGAGRIVGAP